MSKTKFVSLFQHTADLLGVEEEVGASEMLGRCELFNVSSGVEPLTRVVTGGETLLLSSLTVTSRELAVTSRGFVGLVNLSSD